MSLVDMDVGSDGYSSLQSNTNLPCVYLNEDQVEALGLKETPPAAGSVISIQAIGKVTTLTQDSDSDEDGDGIDVRFNFVITEMSIVPSETNSSGADAATVLYGA